MTATAQIKIKADPRELPTGLRAALKMVQGFVHQTTGLMDPRKHAGPDYRSLAVGSAIGGVTSQLAMRGIDMLVDQTKQVFDFNKELIRFGIDIRKMPSEMEAIGKGIREISTQTGLGALEVLKAGRAYADLAGAGAFTMEKMSLIARAAQASGAEVKDMASLMFTLTENLKVPPGELEDTIGGIINQAKDGSIHFRELSHELVALGPVYKQFGVAGREGAIQLGAMMQIARRGFGSASEAGTGVLRILRSIPQHASKFRAAGVQVFLDKSKTDLQNFLTIIESIKKSRLSLDREKLMKAFGRTEGERFFQLLKDSSEQFDKLIEAGRENGTVVRDLGTFTESTAGRIERAMEGAKNAFASALTPERVEQIVGGIQRIAAAMPAIMTAVGKVADAFSAFVHAVRKAKDTLAGKSHFDDFSDEEKDLLRRDMQDEFGSKGMLSASEKTRVAELKSRVSTYNAAMDEIMGLESDFGPTDASVRAAIIASGKGGMAGDAGKSYLIGRDSEIPESQYKRIKAELAADRKLAAQVFGFNPTEKHEMKMAEESVRRIAEAIARAVSGAPPEISIDGNKVNSVTDNASNRRRR